jgi:hypothetical protein
VRPSLSPVCFATALSCAASGCGRVGYEFTHDFGPVERFDASIVARDAASDARDASDTRDGASPGVDGAVGESDAASPMNDGGVTPVDAGVPGDASAHDSSIALPDAGAEDAGGERDAGVRDRFCEEFDEALACAGFSSLPEGFTPKERSGRVEVEGGVLRVRTSERGGAASVVTTFPPVTSGSLYARFLLRVPDGARIVALNLLALGEPLSEAEPSELHVNLLDTSYLEYFSLEGGQQRITSAPGVLQRGEFQCVEMAVEIGASNGRVRISIDGRSVISASGLDTRLSAGIARANLGIDYSSGDQLATSLELDDFLVARQRLAPCP